MDRCGRWTSARNGYQASIRLPGNRTAEQLMFAWSLVGIELETLTSHDKLRLGGKNLEIYQMLMHHVARDSSGLSLARRKDATCFLRWIMSVMTDSTIQACHQRTIGSKTMERRISRVILNVFQSTGIEKEDGSRQSLENHRKLDEIRRFYNKKFEEVHDVHRNLASAGEYSRPNKKGEYQYVSGMMGIAYNPFRGRERSQESRNDRAIKVLDGKDNRDRPSRKREAELVPLPRGCMLFLSFQTRIDILPFYWFSSTLQPRLSYGARHVPHQISCYRTSVFHLAFYDSLETAWSHPPFLFQYTGLH